MQIPSPHPSLHPITGVIQLRSEMSISTKIASKLNYIGSFDPTPEVHAAGRCSGQSCTDNRTNGTSEECLAFPFFIYHNDHNKRWKATRSFDCKTQITFFIIKSTAQVLVEIVCVWLSPYLTPLQFDGFTGCGFRRPVDSEAAFLC